MRYYASDIKLFFDSNAAYLVLPNSKGRITGYFCMSSTPLSNQQPKINAPILVACKTIRTVVASVEEFETEDAFINAQLTLPTRHTLE